MKIYIFNRLEQVSGNYHSGGGAVITARDEQEVKELVNRTRNLEITATEWDTAVIYDLANDECAKVTIFPDAGCCG